MEINLTVSLNGNPVFSLCQVFKALSFTLFFPIHAYQSIFSDNLQPIATRGKKARSTLLVDQHCGNGCFIKRAPLSVLIATKLAAAILVVAVVRRRGCAGPVLPLWSPSFSDWSHVFMTIFRLIYLFIYSSIHINYKKIKTFNVHFSSMD